MRELLTEIAAQFGDESAGQLIDTPSGATLLICDAVVVKLHRSGTDSTRLSERLRLARTAADCLLLPLTPDPVGVRGAGGDGRWVTAWPRIDPVAPDPDDAPWAEAGSLLARLHRTPVPTGGHQHLPQHGAVARLVRALDHLDAVSTAVDDTTAGSTAVEVVRTAARRLPAAAGAVSPAGRPRTLTHGDWHLGQLGRERRPGSPWVLFDLDDLGVGDPVWDLARPAGFWAAGLLPEDDWRAFVDGYRAAAGPAVPRHGDPWTALEAVARAAVVQSAAAGLSRAARRGDEPDEIDHALIEACARMD